MKRIMCGFLFLSSLAAWGAVSGQRLESFGPSQPPATFGQWLGGGHALFTPETANLAVQACLREAQPVTDVSAYPSVHDLTNALKTRFGAPSPQVFPTALAKLAQVTQAIDEIPTSPSETASDYTRECTTRLASLFSAERSSLYPLFEGRMAPKPDPTLEEKGIELVPLTWKSLTSAACQLEGQAAGSSRAELWKLFSLTRLFGSVLPSDEKSRAFESALAGAPEITSLLERLDRYDSVAGKANGSAVAFSSDCCGTLRFTGPAAGSRATALLASFTTGWREDLQRLIISRPYPALPFTLIDSKEILTALEGTDHDTAQTFPHQSSQTELGMSLAWDLLSASQWSMPNDYGPSTSPFRTQASLAWLAMNAETNLRQNEKLAGVWHTVLATGNAWVLGNPGAYLAAARSLDSARSHLGEFLPNHSIPSCIDAMSSLLSSAVNVPSGEVAQLSPIDVMRLGKLSFKPVYADIGLEVVDSSDGTFRLGLATGNGHVYEAVVDGVSYELWTPSAFVLHTSDVLSTVKWQEGLMEYDPAK